MNTISTFIRRIHYHGASNWMFLKMQHRVSVPALIISPLSAPKCKIVSMTVLLTYYWHWLCHLSGPCTYSAPTSSQTTSITPSWAILVFLCRTVDRHTTTVTQEPPGMQLKWKKRDSCCSDLRGVTVTTNKPVELSSLLYNQNQTPQDYTTARRQGYSKGEPWAGRGTPKAKRKSKWLEAERILKSYE